MPADKHTPYTEIARQAEQAKSLEAAKNMRPPDSPEMAAADPSSAQQATAFSPAPPARGEELGQFTTGTELPVAHVAAKLHHDVGHWQGLDCTPASHDVPGYWLRNAKTGIASKVVHEDTLKRCLSEGFLMIEDPTVTPGVPIFGQPIKPIEQLGLGATASVQHIR